MIAFVTLLLGLITGVYPIEVTVSGPVAAVEFTLDGAPAGRIEQPPWTSQIDLGRDLRPRELVARALDAEGREISRASQWLNLPRPQAEVGIVLEPGEDGAPRAALLTWQMVSGVKPAAIEVNLDGEPLKVDANGRAELPSRDLKSLHVLTAELWFPPGLTARKDVVYGGEYGSEISTELTAVPVHLNSGALPGPGGMENWFAASGQPVSVAAVEEGPGKVLVVRVPGGNEVQDKLIPRAQRAVLEPAFRRRMLLDETDKVRFVSLSASPFRSSKVPAELFNLSSELSPDDGGFFWFLTNTRLIESRSQERRIADAVAVAGLQAMAENHRRAVVLVLGADRVQDISHYRPAAVRAYLDAIHVPLFVWSLYGPAATAAKTWSTAGQAVEDVSNPAKMEQAVAKLRAELKSQRIVWLEGRHLPQTVTLAPGVKGVTLLER